MDVLPTVGWIIIVVVNKLYVTIFAVVLVFLVGGGWYLVNKKAEQMKNSVYVLEIPRPNTKVVDDFVIRGKAKHTLDDLIFYAIYDAKYKNENGTELGLNMGSIRIKDGFFEAHLKSVYPESSGQIVLELYTYDPGDLKYEKRINISKIPLVLKRD